jgi:5-dehydro-2-deoxygluconokinase
MCDVIVGNDEEFGFMAGDMEKGLDKARALAAERRQIVVYKMGEKGAITIADGRDRAPASTPHRPRSSPTAPATVSWPACSRAGRGPTRPRGRAARLGLRRDHRRAPRLRPGHANDEAGLDAFLAGHPGPRSLKDRAHAHRAL